MPTKKAVKSQVFLYLDTTHKWKMLRLKLNRKWFVTILVRMPQLTVEQWIFIVETYAREQNIERVTIEFREGFPERRVPAHSTIYCNIVKYRTYGTSQNRNQHNSGRSRTGRSDRNIRNVRNALQGGNRGVSCRCRRNFVDLPPVGTLIRFMLDTPFCLVAIKEG